MVRDALRIKSTDIVSVTTFPHTIDAANAIALECFKEGADAMITLWTDEYYSGILEYLSEDSLREPSKFCQAFTETVTAEVNLFGLENPEILKKLSPSKSAALGEGERKAHFPRMTERKIRIANLSLPLVTKERAKIYGFNFGDWKKVMNTAMTVDLKRISDKGHQIASILQSAHIVHLTSPSGTDLTLQLAGRTVHLDDGIIDEEDVANDSLNTQLPTGFVQTTVAETTGNGKVIFDLPLQRSGFNVIDMEWNFENGRLTSMTAKKNIECVSEPMEKSTGDKDRISTIGIGLNPNARYGFLMNNIVEGSVAVGIGDNESLGGKNISSYGEQSEIGNATLEVDGKTIIRDGKLQL